MTFRELTEDAIFIASSGDVQMLRERTHSVVEAVLARDAPAENLAVYAWERAKATNPFDQRVSMQRDIPRPADPRCRGVICLVGERIGMPLEDEFPTDDMPAFAAWSDPARRYRVLHPWPREAAAQKAALEAGCFPLTGTVFEFLDADGSDTPLHVCYLADRPITPEDDGATLNGGALRLRRTAELDDDALDAWLADEYRPQTKGKGSSASLVELFRPPMLHGRDAEGKYRVDAMMYYSNAVFTADMLVQPGGMVEMQDDEPMLADLPSKIDAPLIVRNEDLQTTH